MAGMSIGGLVSGLDTATIISQLMQLEAQPQTLLSNRVTAANAEVAGYQSVNTRLASALAAATALSKNDTWGQATATSSATSVKATTAAGALAGSVTFDVVSVATSHFTASAVIGPAEPVVPPGTTSITVTQNGVPVQVPITGTDIFAVTSAINSSASGVRASALKVGVDALGVAEYRLQLTSKTSGAAGAFTVDGVPGYDSLVNAGRDAQIDLGAGLVLSSGDGRFVDVLPGTTFSVSAVEHGATVTVAGDTAAVTKSVKAMVDTINTALLEIGSQTKNAVGKLPAGALHGDSMLRGLTQDVLSAVNGGGTSPAEAGIATTRSGDYTFDATKFEALLASDPVKARALVSAMAAQVTAVTTKASDPATGTVTQTVTRRQDSIRGLTAQVDAWDSRLALRRSSLETTYANLETALGKLQSQSSWLSSQLAGLPTWS